MPQLPCPCKERSMNDVVQVCGVGSSTIDEKDALDTALDDMRPRLSDAIAKEEKKYSCKSKNCLPAFSWTPKLDIQPSEQKFAKYTIYTVLVNGTYTGTVKCKLTSE